MDNETKWMEQLATTLEIRIGELSSSFLNELVEYVGESGVKALGIDCSNLYRATPAEYWSVTMHDIYGQVRALYLVIELLDARNNKNKTLPLEDLG